MQAKNLTIMFTDLKGFTAKSSLSSRGEIVSLLETHENLTRNASNVFGGKIVKGTGDGFLAYFESPTNAILCAQELQKAANEYNAGAPKGRKIEIKIAISSGEVLLKGDDIFGSPVNETSRVLGIAETGQIYLTQSVFLSMNKNETKISLVGDKKFKGIPYKVKVYRVSTNDTPIYKVRSFLGGLLFSNGMLKRSAKFGLGTAVFFLIAGSVFAALNTTHPFSEAVEGAKTTGFEDAKSVNSIQSTSSPNSGGGNNGQGNQGDGTQGGSNKGNVKGTQNQGGGSQGQGGNSTSTPKPTSAPKLPKCGDVCTSNTGCPGDNFCINGKCVLKVCTEGASCSGNMCSVTGGSGGSTPPPPPPPSTEPSPTTFSSCSQACNALGYGSSSCMKQPDCNSSGGTVEVKGNMFCSSSDKCCCI